MPRHAPGAPAAALPCRGLKAELVVMEMVSMTETYNPTTLLSWLMLVMPLQQPLCLLHFCATCGHCKRDGQTGRTDTRSHHTHYN